MSIPRKRLSIEERIGEAGSTLYMHWHRGSWAFTCAGRHNSSLEGLLLSLTALFPGNRHRRSSKMPIASSSQARWAVYIFPTLSHGDERILCLRSHQQKGARRWTRRTIHASDLSPRDLLVSAKGNRDLWYKCIQTVVW